MTIEIQNLPREIRDKLELRESFDQTFFRVLEENYTQEFFETIQSRKRVDIEHSYIASVSGSQGCLLETSKILTRNGWKNVKDIQIGEDVLTIDNFYTKMWKPVIKKYIYDNKHPLIKITLKNGIELQVTKEHKFFCDGEFKRAEDLVVGDRLQVVSALSYGIKLITPYMAEILGMIAADGHIHDSFIKRKSTYINKNNKMKIYDYIAHVQKMRLYNSDDDILKKYRWLLKNEFGDNICISEYADKNTRGTRILQIQRQELVQKVLDLGMPSGRKSKIVFVPECIMKGTEEIRTAFLRGLFDCDGSVNKRGHIDYACISKMLVDDIRLLLFDFGIKNKYYYKSRLGSDNHRSDIHRICITEYESRMIFNDKIGFNASKKRDRLVNNLRKNRLYKDIDRSERKYYLDTTIISIDKGELPNKVYDLQIKDNNNYVVNGVLSHNSGKSYLSLGSCFLLDEKFTSENIYFDYNKLVNDRHKLKPHTAVLVDEQSESYGLDSHRVNIILGALKEQLRKKSIHFFFCSPTLKPEFSSSMYVIETLFIDKSQQLTYAAYKTRELNCLGYITVPHPKIIGVPKSLLVEYEKRKDEHLDRLTGRATLDELGERAKMVIKNPIFRQAEFVYLKQRGFIPTNTLMQIINKIYPEFRSNIVVGEIAQRIKFEKEMTGIWEIPGTKKKKQP